MEGIPPAGSGVGAGLAPALSVSTSEGGDRMGHPYPL
jgi:hypothetical protein